jgi:hypothetical protein
LKTVTSAHTFTCHRAEESPLGRQYAWRCKGSIRIPPAEAWFYWVSKVVTAEQLAAAFGAAG